MQEIGCMRLEANEFTIRREIGDMNFGVTASMIQQEIGGTNFEAIVFTIPQGIGWVRNTKEKQQSLFLWAKPCSQAHTALPNAQPKMADAIFGFGLSHTPQSSSVLVQKNDEILKVTAELKEKVNGSHRHATGGLARLRHYHPLTILCTFVRWLLAWKVCWEAATSPSRCYVVGNFGTVQADLKAEN